MIMEIYRDVKEIREKMSSFVTWKGLGTVFVTLATLSIAIFNLAS